MSAVYYEAERPRRVMADYDQGLVWCVLLLMAIGIVMVYSASIAIAEAERFTGDHAAEGNAQVAREMRAPYDYSFVA